MVQEQDAFIRVNAERTLGHDFWSWGRPLPLHCSTAVLEGFAEAAARGGARRRPDRFVRKWLQLRMQALQRERVVSDDVTPDLLRRIDVAQCPVTRATLTHGELLDTDWSVDRLNNDGGYASNNLAVVGTGANRAKGSLSFQDVLSLSQGIGPTNGLTPLEWLRMASIMLGPCFVTAPSAAPVIPLAAPIPSHSARQAVQQVQYVFTRGARLQSGKNSLIKTFARTAKDERCRTRLRVAAEAMHQGLKGVTEPYDAWLVTDVLLAFKAWWETLSLADRALAGELSRQVLGSNVIPGKRVSSWHLGNKGYDA